MAMGDDDNEVDGDGAMGNKVDDDGDSAMGDATMAMTTTMGCSAMGYDDDNDGDGQQ